MSGRWKRGHSTFFLLGMKEHEETFRFCSPDAAERKRMLRLSVLGRLLLRCRESNDELLKDHPRRHGVCALQVQVGLQDPAIEGQKGTFCL